MKKIISILTIALVAFALPVLAATSSFPAQTKLANCKAVGANPDPACTPGAIFATATTKIICVPGYTAKVRSVSTSTKNKIYKEYGIKTHKTGQYEIDHLIPLELGGSNDMSNLWPEPEHAADGSLNKDKVENYLHKQVCAGKISLSVAQHEDATDWLAVYKSITK